MSTKISSRPSKKKTKRNIFDWFTIILNGFLMFFFILYIGKFGLTNLILNPDSKWQIIFNIGIWYVIIMYCIDKFFEALQPKKKQNKEATK